MALPSGIATTTLTFGNDMTFAGDGVAASMVITPTHDVVWKVTGQRLVSFPMSAAATVNHPGSISVPCTDQSGFADGAGNDFANWAYIVRVTYTGSGGTETVTKNWQPVLGQATVDFDLIPSGSLTPGISAPSAVVTSVNGLTGDVTIAAGGGGGGGSGLTVTDNDDGTVTITEVSVARDVLYQHGPPTDPSAYAIGTFIFDVDTGILYEITP